VRYSAEVYSKVKLMANPLLIILETPPVHGLSTGLFTLSGINSFCMENIPLMEGENLK
jgi:hypothetical protein